LLFVLLLVGQPWTGAQDARDPDEASAYKIGIQDQLMVSVYGEPDLTMSVPVRPDGRISLPLVQDIVVAGLSPMAAADRISERLDKLIKDPEVTVIVTGINSFPVYILGEVGGQGVFNFQRPIRLFQALATAGGINEYASGKIVVVRTKPDGTEERMEVDYDDYVHSREDAQNPYLKPGDTILVD
jgi:polysaccharide export outer membrane protein